MDADVISAEVASAVGLAEGPAGVRDLLRVIARHEPVAVREVSRHAELPVPVVAAVCSELRKRGLVDRARPVRLTAAGRAALGGGGDPGPRGRCPCCEGRGVALPDAVAALAGGLAEATEAMPEVRLDLDQTHCTADSKLRRVLWMHESGALGGRRVIVLGDDDLMSLAIAAFAGLAGDSGRPARLVVVDCDAALLGYLADRLPGLAGRAELIDHDLREPLPPHLLGAFDVACTDPPYTVAGAELFLSRAVSALAPGGGAHVFFSFGPRRPGETLRTQRLMGDMGLLVRSLVPGFNSYQGAGVLAGTSHLYHLRSTAESRPTITGSHRGALYTADSRAALRRPYRCAGCGAVHEVGPGARWAVIASLKAAGCPGCGGTVLRPMPLGSAPGPSRGRPGNARRAARGRLP